jgi:lysine N6-hydroxylase
MFTPAYSDYFFQLNPCARQQILREFKLASDGISASVLASIYRRLYEIRYLDGAPPVRLLPGHELIDLQTHIEGGWCLSLDDLVTGQRHDIEADACVLCTGFAPAPLSLFSETLLCRIHREGEKVALAPDFSVVWDGPEWAKLYLQNYARSCRGIADPNLSLLAWRSAKIVNSLAMREVYPLDDAESLVEWRPPLAGVVCGNGP